LVALRAAAPQDQGVPAPLGSMAPRVQVLGLAREAPGLAALGAHVDLARLWDGRPAVLFFYKGDCGASDAAAHVLPRLAAIPRLAVAAISQDGAEETDSFSRTHGLVEEAVQVLVDRDPWPASVAFGVVSTPTFVLVASGGRLAAVLEGWSRDDANALAAHASRLAGAPAPVVSTPSDGPAFRPG
jgi:hypothetical protein